MKINNKRELQNIAIHHSADIHQFTESAQKNHIFMKIDTTLPARDILRFRKKLFDSL